MVNGFISIIPLMGVVMKNHWVSPFLMERRFRRRIKSERKKEQRERIRNAEAENERKYKNISSNIRSYQDALQYFLPRNLKYLIFSEKNSPFYVNKLKRDEYRDLVVISVPEVFSIIDNEGESYSFLKRVASVLLFQTCKDLILDYTKCQNIDLLSQIYLDAILSDYCKFMKICKKANVDSFLNVHSIGGRNMKNDEVRRLLNSVGSPAILVNRYVTYDGVKPYRLRRFDGECVNVNSRKAQKEIDTTTLLDYVNECLSKVNKSLTNEASQNLGYVIGETIINAEEHSSLHYRYLIGYFEEYNEGEKHYGLLNLVIMNFGQTIYEKFKTPQEGTRINERCVEQMKSLSNEYKAKNRFRQYFTEETLWTLYSLQGGVSCIPLDVRQRGNGTIQFINSFFKLKGDERVDDVSCMYLLSGNTRIDFDGTYKLHKIRGLNGDYKDIISFNKSGLLSEEPDRKYVRNVPTYFPGTAIFAKLLINDDDLKNE